jgi:hypothetical protein
VTTSHDFGSVLGRPLDTFFWLSQFRGHGSWLVCELALTTNHPMAWHPGRREEPACRNELTWTPRQLPCFRLLFLLLPSSLLHHMHKHQPLWRCAPPLTKISTDPALRWKPWILTQSSIQPTLCSDHRMRRFSHAAGGLTCQPIFFLPMNLITPMVGGATWTLQTRCRSPWCANPCEIWIVFGALLFRFQLREEVCLDVWSDAWISPILWPWGRGQSLCR